jgi:glycine/D-amino acid oxidase-like deaminating enzyme
MDAELERTGTLSVATEPHQVDWLAEDPGFLVQAATRELVDSPTYLAGAWERHDTALVHPGKLALELARVAVDLGVQVFEWSPVTTVDEGPVITTERGEVHADHVVLATNVFPSLLRRNRLQTVPVYDYVIATEPLTSEQKTAVGWQGRQGIADLANHFHYYRLTADDRIVFRGYDAVYHWGGRVRSAYEERPATYAKLTGHLLTTFPQLEGVAITHRWAGAIDTCSRFCALLRSGPGRPDRLRRRLHRPRGGCVPVRRRRAPRPAGRHPDRADRARDGAPTPDPVPAEPVSSLGTRLTDWSMHRADRNEGKRNVLLKALDAVGMGFDS